MKTRGGTAGAGGRQWAIVLGCLLALAASVRAGTTYYVSAHGSDENEGLNGWADAKQTIAAAVALATTPGDVVWLSNGVHAIAAQVTLNEAITLQGYTTNAEETVIDGGYPGQSIRCLRIQHADAAVRDLTIRYGCYAVEAAGGGGIYIDNGGMVSNCLVISNQCTRAGGGIYILSAGVVLDSRIIANSALKQGTDATGGGIYMATTGRVEGCWVAANTGYYGGGIGLSVNGTVKDTFIVNNSSWTSGGGIFIRTNGLVVDCDVENNAALRPSNYSATGGGLYVHQDGGTVQVQDSRVVSNTAYQAAGIHVRSTSIISNTHILANTSGTYGGGALDGWYYGSTLAGNSANHGGGVVNPRGLFDCTIASNRGNSKGGGMDMENYSVALTVSNCLFACNSGYSGGGISIKTPSPYVRSVEFVDCIISNNKAFATYGGGIGADMANTNTVRVRDCVIVGNTSVTDGGGIAYITKSTDPATRFEISGSRILRNVSSNSTVGGGGVYAAVTSPAVFEARNCLLAENSARNEGGGLYIARTGRVENCTIMCNTAGKTAGLWADSSTPNELWNTIAQSNVTDGGAVSNYPWDSALNFVYCSAFPAPPVGEQVQTGDPKVAGGGDYRLASHSPCIDAGQTETWMSDALDAAGLPRLDRFTGRVDIGAYEYQPAGVLFKLR